MSGEATPGESPVEGVETSVEGVEDKILDTLEGSERPGTPVEEGTTVDPREGINALADQLGIDKAAFSTFETVDEAQGALQQYLSGLARSPLDTVEETPADLPAPSKSHASPSPAVDGAIDLSALGIDDSEPVARVVRQLEAKLESVKADSEGFRQKLEQEAQERASAQQQAVHQEFETLVSAAKSPKYGTSDTRNVFQSQRVEHLRELVNGIAILAYKENRSVPPLTERVKIAMELDGAKPAAKPSANGATLPNPSGGSSQQVSEEVSFYEDWSENDVLLRLAGKQ